MLTAYVNQKDGHKLEIQINISKKPEKFGRKITGIYENEDTSSLRRSIIKIQST